ncbi:hypothetical protein OH76DRAFT_1205370 [Lentinus brumalis]|uniref:Uncharacterized protein n=1 Tax=Lentinus brumalis TaxID=2498619 RepID=A0A371CSQ1_9APHY|nr:hypothetical protein OH76DRAFT_1205370 [Polyporus brumalis]
MGLHDVDLHVEVQLHALQKPEPASVQCFQIHAAQSPSSCSSTCRHGPSPYPAADSAARASREFDCRHGHLDIQALSTRRHGRPHHLPTQLRALIRIGGSSGTPTPSHEVRTVPRKRLIDNCIAMSRPSPRAGL